MSYTTVTNVANLFPNFTRNGPKGPSDDVIQDFINDEASQINAILQRRFSEAISAFPGANPAAQFMAYIASFVAGSDQMNLLEHANTFAAAGELVAIFEATSGAASLSKLASAYEAKAQAIYQELDGRDEKGEVKKDGGRYDKLFDSSARSISPRPDFFGVAGGDQPRAKDEDVSDYFTKWPGIRAD
jgi:hypothetical protein